MLKLLPKIHNNKYTAYPREPICVALTEFTFLSRLETGIQIKQPNPIKTESNKTTCEKLKPFCAVKNIVEIVHTKSTSQVNAKSGGYNFTDNGARNY